MRKVLLPILCAGLILLAFAAFLAWPTADMEGGVRPEIFEKLSYDMDLSPEELTAALAEMRTNDPHVFDNERGLAVVTLLADAKSLDADGAKAQVDALVGDFKDSRPDLEVTEVEIVEGEV